MAEDAKIGGNSNGVDNETVKRSPLSKKPNVLTGVFYLPTLQKDNFPLIFLAIVEALS